MCTQQTRRDTGGGGVCTVLTPCKAANVQGLRLRRGTLTVPPDPALEIAAVTGHECEPVARTHETDTRPHDLHGPALQRRPLPGGLIPVTTPRLPSNRCLHPSTIFFRFEDVRRRKPRRNGAVRNAPCTCGLLAPGKQRTGRSRFPSLTHLDSPKPMCFSEPKRRGIGVMPVTHEIRSPRAACRAS